MSRWPEDRPLTLKQELFAEHYLGDAAGVGAEAARQAGYRGSPQVLAGLARENLNKPQIAARVRSRVAEVGKTADECLLALAEIIDLENERFFSAGKESKATLADKVRAVELMMKYHRMLVDRAEVNVTETKRITIHSISVVPSSRDQATMAIEGSARETGQQAGAQAAQTHSTQGSQDDSEHEQSTAAADHNLR